MSATMHALQVSKFGPPLIVFLSEYSAGGHFWIEAHAVRPEPAGGAKVEQIVRLGLVQNFRKNEDYESARDLMSRSRDEEILLFAAKEAEQVKFPAEQLALGEVDRSRLQAWRSIGLYPGLEDGGLPAQSATLAYDLEYTMRFHR